MSENPLVLAAHAWPTNSDLIADVARIGYLRPEWLTFDATYKLGNWWKRWRPDTLITNDLDETVDCQFHEDFRDTQWESDYFDAIAYDPPYVAAGGRKTSTLGSAGMTFHNRFGMDLAPKNPKLLQELMDDGLAEMVRIVRPNGIIITKAQDYVTAKKLHPGTFLVYRNAMDLGLELVDRFERLQKTARPQPANRHSKGTPTKQQHARHNFSTLFVFRKKKVR